MKIESQFTVQFWIYLWILFSSIYQLVLGLEQVNVEFNWLSPLNLFFFFFSSVLALLGSLHLYMNFRITFLIIIFLKSLVE